MSNCMPVIFYVCRAARLTFWLPINYRIDYEVASLVHKVRSTGRPAYLQALISDYTPARQLRSSRQFSQTKTRLDPFRRFTHINIAHR